MLCGEVEENTLYISILFEEPVGEEQVDSRALTLPSHDPQAGI